MIKQYLIALLFSLSFYVYGDLYLVFDIALTDTADNPGGLFAVDIESAGKIENLYQKSWGAQKGFWLPQAIKLNQYAGKAVTLHLKNNTAYGALGYAFLIWGNPRIIRGDIAAPGKWEIIESLAESHRLNKNGERWARNPGNTQTKANGYNIKENGFLLGPGAGPEYRPALFGHPYFEPGVQDWCGYAFKLNLPDNVGIKSVKPPEMVASASFVHNPVITDFSSETLNGEAVIDLQKNIIVRLNEENNGYAFGGIEFANMEKLNGLFSSKKIDNSSSDNKIAAVIVDFHNGKYFSKRLWIVSTPKQLPRKRWEYRAPVWNLRFDNLKYEEEFYRTEEMIAMPAILSVNLKKYAPPGWTGRVWVGAGIQDCGKNSECSIRIQ